MALIPEPPPPWWEDMTQYTIDSSDPFPNDTSITGPKDVATVFVYGNGTTQPGWGLTGKKQDDGTFAPGFMELYDQLKFAPSVTKRDGAAGKLPAAPIGELHRRGRQCAGR